MYSKRSGKYKKLITIRRVLEEESQFPEALCDCATRLIYEEIPFITIMNGTFRGSPHVWAYDMEQKLHIDITLDQFDTQFEPITIITTDEAIKLGYELGNLSDWSKLFESNFFSLNKSISRKKTMRNVLRKIKTRSRFSFW